MIASLPMSQSAILLNRRDEQARLNSCIEYVETDPDTAYEDSLAWLSNGNRPLARYCNALALIALDQFEQGAARLEALANAPEAITLDDRTLFMTQAGNAWLSAGLPEAAETAFDAALNMTQTDPDLFKDRAAARLAQENWLSGIDDLNAALALRAGDAEALALRARAQLATGELQQAERDLTEALRAQPDNIEFLVLRGDIREAQRLKAPSER
jgi:tetratricopeptide (TPR) repeat protein